MHGLYISACIASDITTICMKHGEILFKFTKNEDVFLNASDKEMLDYFASIWGVFNKAYTQFKLPAVTLDETLDAIFKEGE